MVYEKEKIRRLINYKDEILNSQIKNDLEWILCAYNKYFLLDKDNKQNREEYKKLLIDYYNLEDEKMKLIERINFLERRCTNLKKEYKILEENCKK